MKNIQYYSHICICGCGEQIKIKEYILQNIIKI